MNRTVIPLNITLIWTALCSLAAAPIPQRTKQLVDDYLAKRPSQSVSANLNLDEARHLQREFVARLTPTLGPRVGFKVGLTSKAVQESVGATAPVRGVLLRDMILQNGATVSANFGARPIWEPDLVVVVKDAAINKATTPLEVAEHLSEVVAFIELPDRIVAESEKVNGQVITAINAGARLGILGARRKIEPTREFVAALQNMTVRAIDQNGAELAKAKGDALLGHPLNPVLWLTRLAG